MCNGLEQVASSDRVHHETNNLLILADCSSAFNTDKRTAVLPEAATCMLVRTSLVAKCDGERSAPVSFPIARWSRAYPRTLLALVLEFESCRGEILNLFACRSCRCGSGPERSWSQEVLSVRLPGRHQHRNDGNHF